MTQFNNRIRQVVLLMIIAFLGFLIIKELYVFLPGLMGALTFYILGRERFFRLTEQRGWKAGLTAMLFIIVFLLVIAAPIYYAVVLVSPRINNVFDHAEEFMTGLKALSDQVKAITGEELFRLKPILTAIQSRWLYSYLPEQFSHDSQQPAGHVLCSLFHVHWWSLHGRGHQKIHTAPPGKCAGTRT